MLDWQNYTKILNFSASRPYLFGITQVNFLLEMYRVMLYTFFTDRCCLGGEKSRLLPRVFVRKLSRIDKNGSVRLFCLYGG